MLEKSETGKKRKKKQSEIKLWTSTIHLSQESSRTDPYEQNSISRHTATAVIKHFWMAYGRFVLVRFHPQALASSLGENQFSGSRPSASEVKTYRNVC